MGLTDTSQIPFSLKPQTHPASQPAPNTFISPQKRSCRVQTLGVSWHKTPGFFVVFCGFCVPKSRSFGKELPAGILPFPSLLLQTYARQPGAGRGSAADPALWQSRSEVPTCCPQSPAPPWGPRQLHVPPWPFPGAPTPSPPSIHKRFAPSGSKDDFERIRGEFSHLHLSPTRGEHKHTRG